MNINHERHHDEVGLAAFQEAMRTKLSVARSKGRYGWHDEMACGIDHLRELLKEQIETPLDEDWDLVDIANFAMMLWNRAQWRAGRVTSATMPSESDFRPGRASQ